MVLNQIDVTGCRLIGAIDKVLGHAGPKHHAVILGESVDDGEVYIAESMHYGYQSSTYSDFCCRYECNGDIIIEPNDGELENISVAQRAIAELKEGGLGIYNLVTNNCECFVNRIMHNKSVSNQVINTAIGLLVLAGLVYVCAKSKK